jgi:hypothetical protein
MNHVPSIHDGAQIEATYGRLVTMDTCGQCDQTIYWSESYLAWFTYINRAANFNCNAHPVS